MTSFDLRKHKPGMAYTLKGIPGLTIYPPDKPDFSGYSVEKDGQSHSFSLSDLIRAPAHDQIVG